jgi:hypothetical protein
MPIKHMSDVTPEQHVDLDRVYTELAEAAGRLGAEKTPLFLATLALAMLIDRGPSTRSLDFIAQAERLTLDSHEGPNS